MIEKDMIMDEIYATRQRISERYGHNPDLYLKSVHEKELEARALGLSFAEYCLQQLSGVYPFFERRSASHPDK